MKLKQLTVENFQSLGKIVFDFPKGLILIDGYNKDAESYNGVGKSALLNSIAFAIYGKIPKNIVLNDLIRDGKEKLSTEIELEINNKKICIQRIRTLKSSKVKLIADGQTVDGLMKDIENKILNIVKLTFEQFVQIIYIFQGSGNRFISLNDTEKKQFLSTLLNLEIYDEAYKKAHSELNQTELNLSNLSGQSTSLQYELARITFQKTETDSQYNDIISTKDQKIKELTERGKIIKEQLSELEKSKVIYSAIDSAIGNYGKELQFLKGGNEEIA